jgi:hypothetical protein
MKTFLTTTAIVAALTFSAYAEGDINGDEALGEANGTVKASTQDLSGPQGLIGQYAMAQAQPQGTLSRSKNVKSKGAASAKAQKASAQAKGANASAQEVIDKTPENLKSPAGMDGGNRR